MNKKAVFLLRDSRFFIRSGETQKKPWTFWYDRK